MRHYSEERKASVLVKLMPPHNKTYTELSKEENIPVSTIHTWVRKKQGKGMMATKIEGKAALWSTAESRFSVIVETATMTEHELGEYCREYGLYPEKLKEWKAQFIRQLTDSKSVEQQDKAQSKEDKKKIVQLEKELKRKDKALAEAAALLVLGKKLQAFYGEGSEDD
jgi:transposase-like protein